MTELLQQTLNGLSLGAIYALVALGYTMVYGVLRFINFAHSEVFMCGAFAGYYLAPLFPTVTGADGSPHLPLWAGLLVLFGAMLVGGLLGVAIERLAYRPLRGQPRLNCLITAIGVSLLLQNLGQIQFGATPRPFPALMSSSNLEFAGLVIGGAQLMVLAVSLLLMAGLRALVMHTRIGLAMRAVALDESAASLVGVNIGAVVTTTFGLGSALGAAGGVLYAVNYPSIDPLMGLLPGMKGFVAAVLGGIGSIPGAVLGGLLLGVAETFANGSELSTWTDALAFALLIAVLLFRPSGLLGRGAVDKV